MENNKIVIQVTVNAPIEKVWEIWTQPKHITKWAFASDDWMSPSAENDLRVDGKFKTRMEAKDKNEGFDFEGVYSTVEEYSVIEYDMSDGRHVKTVFEQLPEGVRVTQIFDPENENSIEMQRHGWQEILNNFKNYTETR